MREQTTAMIPVVLGEAESASEAEELAQQYDELTTIKEEKKKISSEIKGREDYVQAQVRRLSEIVKTGIENFEQPCEKVYDAENKLVWWETSTGTQYHKRDMRDDELEKARQGNLFEGDAGEVM